MILDKVEEPKDVKKLSESELPVLAEEIRRYMIETVSLCGGHLASSLGTTELIIALCRMFDFPEDKIVFDVGHQCYAYKILTGRKDVFNTLRQDNGISGFPKREESAYDSFNTGHSSTSISAALGLAVSRDLNKQNHYVLAVIGDGALTGGMAYEALNNAGSREEDLIVILNDNQMSISPNVGAVANYLNRARTAPNYGRRKQHIKDILDKSDHGQEVLKHLRRFRDSVKYLMVQGMFFEEMGFTYLGPLDGHDIPALERTLGYAKNAKGPVLIHVLTDKGKGYSYAEAEPHRFHGIAPFDPKTGKLRNPSDKKTFSHAFGETLLSLAEKQEDIVAITAAMPDGTGLTSFKEKYPRRYFDVGIAEAHAVTFAAGLAAGSVHPCVAIYSSFLQRGEDQIYHDVCLQNLPVVFAVDRSGVVGEDGETHQGIYDIALMRSFPNLILMSPSTEKEMSAMLSFAFSCNGPVALRYPRGAVGQWDENYKHAPVEAGKGEVICEGDEVVLLPLGIMMDEAVSAKNILEKQGINVGIYNPRFVKPIDKSALIDLTHRYRYLVTIEDHVLSGGYGSAVLEILNNESTDATIISLGYPDEIIRQGKRKDILSKYGLTGEKIAEKISGIL